ncbi:Methylcrotonoyl-CoA carboxylase beta chain [Diplonema papillatum]|nr:Methylcrotonoyl-CoA carboxylase beta chain [Diplonema papillatum]
MKGGTTNGSMIDKILRGQEIARENRLMTVSLTQSGGADLRQQERVFHAGGRSFANQARASKAGDTSVSVVFGPCTAGGAYQPGMSDYNVFVKDSAAAYLGGPPLVKMATGEVATDEELGGALMHSVKSGVSDFFALDERHAIRVARELVAAQHRRKFTPYPRAHLASAVEPPAYPAEELLGVFDGVLKQAFDISEVIARVVDGSRLTFFKPEYGKTTVCAFGQIHGFPVGFIGNNGVLMPDSTHKATQFIHRCNIEGKPIVFLHNITGFMVGTESEQAGLIKHGSLLINAVSNCVVPIITIMVGASYGAGNYAMAGKAYNPRFIFSWPSSKCGVMGPEQLSGVLDIVQRRGFDKKKAAMTAKQVAAAENRFVATREGFRKQVEMTTDVYYVSSRAIDDGVIDPRDTRNVLAFTLSVIYNADVVSGGVWGVSRM